MGDYSSAHARSSHTADGVAFHRTFTSIPLCKEIFQCSKRQLNGAEDGGGKEEKKMPGLAPFIEARYLLTDRLLKKSGITQIFEYAAGLTPRSILFGAANPDARCVEFDLVDKILMKERIVLGLVDQKHISEPTNVWFEDGNVTDIVALATASRHFRNEPIAILNEGSDRYLSRFERTLKLSHNHRLLKHFGGVNITPDIQTKTGMAAIGKMRSLTGGREAVTEADLGFRLSEHYYDDVKDATAFYHWYGFHIEDHSLVEVMDELTSPKILGLDPNHVEEMLSQLHAFVLRPI